MKQIIMIFTILITLPSLAGTMCAINDTIAIILDPSIDVSHTGSYAADSNRITWWIATPYHKFHGTSACLSKDKASASKKITPLLKDKDSNGVDKFVVGGERNGNYCWCRLQHPVVTSWMAERQYSDCATSCANYCAVYFRTPGLEQLLYDSIQY